MNRYLMPCCLFLGFFFWSIAGLMAQEGMYKMVSGKVGIKSDAPLEVIEAQSTMMKGVIRTKEMQFAFSVPIRSFEGFNSPLQKVHFNENYMESNVYPNATFSGKIIEKVDLTEDGNYTVRAKGQLMVHGVTQERIIKSEVAVKNGQISIHSQFTILLEEHHINIPRIVNQKIAEEITITIEGVLESGL